MFVAEISKIVMSGYVPISVSINYDDELKKYTKNPSRKDWTNTTLDNYKSKLTSSNGIGILTGSKHNLLVIDIDVKDKGLETWNRWIEEYGIEDTVFVKTPTGGYHYYFTCDEETASKFKTSRKSFIYQGERVGIDIRCNGGFVVCPPSKQGDKPYEWGSSLFDELLGDVPLWLEQFLTRPDDNYSYDNIKKLYSSNNMNLKIIEFSELELAEYFVKQNKDDYRVSYKDECEGDESKLKQIFKWDDKIKIFEPINIKSLALHICNFYKKMKNDYCLEDLEDKNKLKEFSKILKFVKSICGRNKMINLSKLVVDILINTTKNFNDYKELNTHLINFRNGCYDLKNNIFRHRKRDDFVSIYLDYDYNKSQINEINKVKEIIKNISNDDNDTLGFMLNYLGYCLTGETRAKKFLILYGASASNGKTTLQEIFSKCLKNYTFKIDRETFNYKYDKFHKQLIQCRRPKRMVFLEEMNKNKLDISKLKEFVDGNDTNCNIMYGTSDLVKVDAKLIIATNNSPVFDTDNGILRRGILIECNNKFVDKDTYDKLKHKKGIYLKDERIMDLFDVDEYKRAFINLLIPHAVNYYKYGLQVPKKINNCFKELCEENDTMKSFIDSQFEITHNDSDRIGKDDFLLLYNEIHKCKLTFRHLLSDIKRLNIEYDRQKRWKGKKGCLIGIKYKDYIDDKDNFIE